MAVRSIALLVALGACGRFGFESSSRDAPGDGPADGLDAPPDALDAPVPCGAFGTVKAERAVAGNLIDIDRISVTPTSVLVAVNVGMNYLYTFDHDLGPITGPMTIVPPSNIGISYDPTTGEVYSYQNAIVNSQLAKLTLAGAVVAGPIGSGVVGGSGFVDPQGHLHITMLNSNGFREYDGALALVSTWGTIASTGFDAAYDPVTQLAWHVSTTGTITPFDLSQAGRPPGTSFVISQASGIQVDSRGTLYVLSRPAKRIYVVRPAPVVVDMITFTDDPAALTYDPVTDRLLVGFYTPAVIRQLCPYVP